MASRASTGSDSNAEVESDGQLIELVRGGDMSAFDELYERHLSIASTVAKRNVDNPSDAEDVVADAFQSVLQSLVAGKGPDNFFRAYLLSTVTRLSHHRNRKAGKTLPSGEDSVLDHTLAEPDAAVKAFESQTVAKAFRALPERWQAVLWYLDVERMKPAAVAPILGLSANAVSALALRAREGLRRQYLQAHIAEEPKGECAEFASKLGNFIRGGLSSIAERKVRGHLQGCAKCTSALAELKDVQGTMRAVLLPLITGIPLTAWAGKGAGLGILGGLVPVKAAIALPAIAPPTVMVMAAAAGLGLIVGTLGVIGPPAPGARVEQPVVEVTATQAAPTSAAPSAPVESPSPSPVPSTPVIAPEPSPEPVRQEPMPAAPPVEPVAPPEVHETPPPSVAPSPSVSPLASPASVRGFVWEARDDDAKLAALQVDFTAEGSKPTGAAKAVFTVGEDMRILRESIEAPEGWRCDLEENTTLTCVTNSMSRSDIHFHITTEARRKRTPGLLTYSLSGEGLVPSEFVYNY